jgi:thiol:disulfide interchange protein
VKSFLSNQYTLTFPILAMAIYLLTRFSYLSLIVSEVLPFCTWLDANGILHGILLLCQALWLFCRGSEKTELTRHESVWLRQRLKKTLNSILPTIEDGDHTQYSSHGKAHSLQTVQCPRIQIQVVQKPYKESRGQREPSPYP